MLTLFPYFKKVSQQEGECPRKKVFSEAFKERLHLAICDCELQAHTTVSVRALRPGVLPEMASIGCINLFKF